MGKSIVNLGELEALVRTVPPTATVHWQRAHLDIPNKPGRPMVELTSKLDGHTEIVPALPKSEEWDAWVAEMQEWYDEVDRIQEEKSYSQLEYHLDYALVGWRDAGSDNEWELDPPDDWNPPNVLERHGIDVTDDRRLAYILYVVLDEPWKINTVAEKAWRESKDPEHDASPITQKEISAVQDKFRSGDADTRRHVGSASGSRGSRNSDERIRTRDAQGRQHGARSGFLVRLIPWL